MMESYRVSSEVRPALAEGRVVALESSIICQGMPWPHNLETALRMEEAIRAEGAVPATIAIVDGAVRVGLDRGELEELSQRRDAVKAGVRDLPWVEMKRLTAGTTVSATMAVADAVGIRVFATGGIGGVHHGDLMDISSDLVALSRFNTLVVCSGAKSFLDLANTLEVLETLCVPVIGYRTDELPGFYVRSTGLKVPYRLDEISEVVEFARAKWLRPRTGQGGILLTNPVPAEAAADDELIASAVSRAKDLVRERGLTGKAVTPFILDQIRRLTEGVSLRANMALAVDNARLGGRIASRLGRIGE